MQPMLEKAKEFQSIRPLLPPGSGIRLYPDVAELPVEAIARAAGGQGSLLISFSYFFGQRLTPVDIENLSELFVRLVKACRVDNTYILYLNADAECFGEHYLDFKSRVGLEGASCVSPYNFLVYRNFGLLDQPLSRRLAHEALPVDWRIYG